MKPIFLAAVLALSTIPAAGQLLTVSPEAAVGTRRIVESGWGSHPELASNGRGFLWIASAGRIEAGRLDANGVLLDATRIAVSAGYAPRFGLASDGDDYLAVYVADGRFESAFLGEDGSVEVHRDLLADLEVRDLALAWAGDHYVLGIVDGTGRVGTLPLDRGGLPIGGAQFFGAASNGFADPILRLAFDGRSLFAVWQASPGTIRGQYLTPAGAPREADIFTIAGNDPDLTFDGRTFLLAWHDTALRVATLRGTRTQVVSTLPQSASAFRPRLAADGRNIVVSWHDGFWAGPWTEWVAVLDAAGHRIRQTSIDSRPPPFDVILADVASTTVAFVNGTFLTLSEVARKQAAADGWQPRPIVVRRAAVVQSSPAIANGPGGQLAVWLDSDAGYSGPGTWRAAIGGGATIDLGTHAPANPAVAGGATTYLVVGTDAAGLIGMRLDAAGTVLDPAPFRIAGPGAGFAVAWDGQHYLVAFATGGFPSRTMNVARITERGEILDPVGVPVSDPPSYGNTSPSIASDGTRSLVVWQELGLCGVCPGSRLVGRMVRNDATTQGPLLLFGTSGESAPRVASSGLDFLVTWKHDEIGRTSFRQCMVSSDGRIGATVIGSLPASGYRNRGALVWNGRHYVAFDADPYGATLEARLIDRNAANAGAAFTVLKASDPLARPFFAGQVAAAVSGDGTVTVLYTRPSHTDADGDSERLFRVTVSEAGGRRRGAAGGQ